PNNPFILLEEYFTQSTKDIMRFRMDIALRAMEHVVIPETQFLSTFMTNSAKPNATTSAAS
ncbi:MAG: hypothetical protein J7K65_00695, partial [Planctomycetes bacterium]|nr:hypothetical protein [Planctomycetota bacterium]